MGMSKSQYMKYISDQACGRGKVNLSQVIVNLKGMLEEVKANRKYYSVQWYFDSLENYRKIAKEAYRAVIYQAEYTIKSTDAKIADVEARVFNPQGDSQDEVNKINSLVARMTAEVKSNPNVAPVDILSKYEGTSAGAKAIIQGISDGKFDAGVYTAQLLRDCLLASKSQSEIAFEARKADDIKKIKADGLSQSDLGTYFAITRLQQMAAIDAEVDKLIADAKNEVSEAKVLDELNGFIKGQMSVAAPEVLSAFI